MRTRLQDGRAFDSRGKDFLEIAHSYLSEAFPNPDRQGCPPDDALRSLAFNPTEGKPGVTEHLALCSPCFIRYGELLAEWKTQREEEKRFTRGSMSVWTKAHPALAGTVVLCLVLFGIALGFLISGIRQPNTPPTDAHRKPNPTEPRNATVASLPFSLDLSALSPIRGSESAPPGTARHVLVPNSLLDLTLTLPLASPEGGYDLKLMAGAQTFWSKPARAHLQKGKTRIQVEADFTHMQAGNYTLEVRSSTGIRFVQPVVISQSVREELVRP